MNTTIQFGAMAVQFLAEGALIERGGAVLTVAFVDDQFAYSRSLADYGTFNLFARDEAGRMQKFTLARNTMVTLLEELTEVEAGCL
jgi:hypothetical protein